MDLVRVEILAEPQMIVVELGDELVVEAEILGFLPRLGKTGSVARDERVEVEPVALLFALERAVESTKRGDELLEIRARFRVRERAKLARRCPHSPGVDLSPTRVRQEI